MVSDSEMEQEEQEEKLAALIAGWRRDPVQFVRDNFQVEPDAWQVRVLTAFANTDDPQKRRISMQACKGPGKTAVLAWCIWNFLLCYSEKGMHPKGAATSVTDDNLKMNLWPELAKWQGRSPLLMDWFEWSKERVSSKKYPATWFFSARAWPKQADQNKQADTLSGIHAEYILFVLDESGGIPDAVMATAEAGLSTCKWGKIVQAGNPTHLEGPLWRASKEESHLWFVTEITGDPNDPNRSPRVSRKWALEQIDKYGIDNPWVLVNVFGKFPPSSINALLGPDDIKAARKRQPQPNEYSFSQVRIGVDVARFGNDRTVLSRRQGKLAYPLKDFRNLDSMEVADQVALMKKETGSELELVDGTGGHGSGVIDKLRHMGYEPLEVNFSAKATNPRYFNKRSEMYFLMAEWIKAGGCLPQDDGLEDELCAVTYTFQNDKLRIEEKELIRQRLGVSPDKADALAMTFAVPDQLRKVGLEEYGLEGLGPVSDRKKARTEYDPFDMDRICPPRE